MYFAVDFVCSRNGLKTKFIFIMKIVFEEIQTKLGALFDHPPSKSPQRPLKALSPLNVSFSKKWLN